ncbi:MAG: hypothetical protein PPP58_06060 [Natronomonas sp.]
MNADRPRIAVIGYGSLLQPSALRSFSESAAKRAVPVRVDGLCRIFNQQTSWRSDDETACAVANAVRDDDAWLNGIVIPDIRRAEFRKFRERERWYRLIEVPIDDVAPYDGDDRSRIEDHELIVTTTGMKTDPNIEPIPSYVAACLDGAATWGETVREEFVATTRTNSGDPLTAFLE